MNTRASVAYGWGILILAGGGAYYFAKRSINSDRADRAANIEKERQFVQRLRESEYSSKPGSTKSSAASDNLNGPLSPSKTGIQDPAPDAPKKGEPVAPSKYAASEPFRSRKGDRFS